PVATIRGVLAGNEGMMSQQYRMYIDGEWCAAESGQTYDAINPATAQSFGKIPKGSREDARRAIAAANRAAKTWSKVPLWERAALCQKMAQVVAEHVEDLADVLCTELGKPRHGEALDEARETPVNYRQAAEQAKFFEGNTIPAQ